MAPLDTPRAAAGIGSLRIVQNSPSSAVLQASFGTTGRKSTIEFRLAAGQIGLEMLPRDAAKVRVRSRTRYVVVPDFFGNDMVLSPQMFRRTRLGLPAEKFFLNLLDGGNAMLMCVWQSAEARADAILSADAHEPLIAGCDIGCGKDKSLWVAFLEGADLWHEQSIPAEKASQDVSLDWRVPFSAKWRADFLRPDGFASSWYFPSSEFNDSRSMGPNAQPCPCAFRAGQASVRAELGCAGVVVYPIDRTRSTPLTAFCPINILRSTLGVGPCQYILQTEGLASETNPTPDEVVTWADVDLPAAWPRSATSTACSTITCCWRAWKRAATWPLSMPLSRYDARDSIRSGCAPAPTKPRWSASIASVKPRPSSLIVVIAHMKIHSSDG